MVFNGWHMQIIKPWTNKQKIYKTLSIHFWIESLCSYSTSIFMDCEFEWWFNKLKWCFDGAQMVDIHTYHFVRFKRFFSSYCAFMFRSNTVEQNANIHKINKIMSHWHIHIKCNKKKTLSVVEWIKNLSAANPDFNFKWLANENNTL